MSYKYRTRSSSLLTFIFRSLIAYRITLLFFASNKGGTVSLLEDITRETPYFEINRGIEPGLFLIPREVFFSSF